MKIAIISDTHDNMANTKKAVTLIQEMGAEVLFFCGDFCAGGPGRVINKFVGPVYAIFGNNDGDKVNVMRHTIGDRTDVIFFDESEAIFELDNRKIALTHYPLYANALARTGDYDLVCFGHDHRARIENYGNCIAINPGTLNPNPLKKDITLAFAIYDTKTHSAELYDLSGNLLA